MFDGIETEYRLSIGRYSILFDTTEYRLLLDTRYQYRPNPSAELSWCRSVLVLKCPATKAVKNGVRGNADVQKTGINAGCHPAFYTQQHPVNVRGCGKRKVGKCMSVTEAN